MSDIRYNGWLHRSGTGGVWQDSSGRVGVGTSTPNMSLHVLSSSDDVARLQSTSTSNGPALTLDHIGASPADGDIIGKVVFNGEDDGANSTTYADIRVISTDVSNGSEDGDITFGTRAAGSYAERLRIASDGKIGIGEDDPDGNTLLIRAATTVGTTKGHIMLTGDSATNGQGPQIVFSESGSGSNHAGAYIGHVRTTTNSVGDLVFATRATGGDANTIPTERLRILSNGRIGVGTESSSSALQIYASDEGEGTAKGQITLKDTAAYNAAPQSGIVFQGHHASNNAQAIWSGIRGFKANAADGDYDGCLAFDVRKHGAVAYEAMRINEDGNCLLYTSPSPRDS